MLALVLLVSLGFPQASPTFRAWNQPVEPFRVAGSLYYVGTENITSLLLTTPRGHVLIDGGLEESAPLIAENVRKLGFRVQDVKVLLSTHAHADHAGGLARLKQLTGARLYAGAADAGLLARGGRGDFAFGDTLPFPGVKADVAVRDGEEIAVGGVRVRALATPGHTKGCTSWIFTIDDNGTPRTVLMIGGTSAPGYRLVANPAYPGIADDFLATFGKLRALRADIVFEGHGFAFDLEARRHGKRPFVDPGALKASVDKAEADFRKLLAEQQAAGQPRPGSGPPARRPDIHFAPTLHAVADEMLRLAGVSGRDVVYDLGSGDGRIVILAAQKFGARAVGVELDHRLVEVSREVAREGEVAERATFIEGDLFETDISQATVVTLYLSPVVNRELEPKLRRELKPGTRIVSHQFAIGRWPPDSTARASDGTDLFLWVVRK